MAEVAFTRCAQPTVTARRISTYTVLGFTGYAVASVLGAVLAVRWDLTLGDRLIGFFVPPIAFILVVTVATAIVGRERIVFYQTAYAGVLAVAGASALAGTHTARLVDLATLGIGTFLVFGRLGCTAVACCHGTLGRGITYGPPHVAVGFFARWSGRALWPVQLIEAAASLGLVIAGLACSAEPGAAAQLYIEGYATIRFALELVRGDGARPYLGGLSEAQWLALTSAAACAVWRPGPIALAPPVALALAAGVLFARRRRRALVLPPHLLELDRALDRARDGTRAETSLGVAVSGHALPDGRIDWVLSSSHPAWSPALAGRLARALWPSFELVPGRTPGVIHVVAAQ
ncbi:MAG TPA: prolipoprotein diacylglyceryl transferase family protein [Kofleriaceae bacterium]|nr:prolipoprotein diacylglyceryl transferase family protein [Kofleriaceae bacterium]